MSDASIDQIRSVPEISARLLSGAPVSRENGTYIIGGLNGKTYKVDPDGFERADGIARALSIRQAALPQGSEIDILDLRQEALNILLDDLFGSKDLLKILFVPAGQMASAWLRAMIPASTLSQNNLATAHHTMRLDPEKVSHYDILWIQLIAEPLLYDIASFAKANGIKIIYDVDDRFDQIPKDNPASALFQRDQVENVWKMIELADLVTVSTPTLAAHLSPRANAIKVLPNMITATAWPKAAPPDPHIFRILWSGSATHSRDLGLVAKPLANILKSEEGRVRFTLFGETLPAELADVAKLVDLKKFVDFEEYPEALAEVGADLAIAPLVDDEFNSGKSAIRYLDYSACGYLSLLSPVGEYKEIIASGAPGVLVYGDWEAAIRLAIADPEIGRAMGREAQAWVRKNRCVMNCQAVPWLEAARGILDAVATPN